MMQATYANFPQRIGTIVARERMTRFSASSIGYLWAFLNPIIWIAFVVLLFRFLQRTPPIHVGAEIFVATGILPYVAFRGTVTTLSRAFAAHRYLLYIRPVSTTDIIVSVSLLEGVNTLITSLLIFGIVSLVFGAAGPAHPAIVLLGVLLAWVLGAGLGRFFAAISILSESFARMVPTLLRPFFWLSGIFYTATELPGQTQALLWYSPMLHVTEIMREGYFLGYVSPIVSVWMPLGVAAALFIAAMPLEAYARRTGAGKHRL